MQLELLGLSGARIQSRNIIILLAPPVEASGLKVGRLKADVAVLGRSDDQTNIAPNDEQSPLFIINSPGEHETKGVFFYCLGNTEQSGGRSLLSSLALEDITLTHLGGLNRRLTSAELELFEGTDVLFVPVGGGDVLSAQAASDLVGELEPRVVIPMHFALPGLKTRYDEVGNFLKIMGEKPPPQDKIKITKKDLPLEGRTIIYLQP